MNQIADWFRRLFANMSAGLARFMSGRYGNDRLNLVILSVGCVVCIAGMFVPNDAVRGVLSLLSYALLIWSIFRSLSRNTYKRYQENRAFWQFFDHLKDREHRYFTCPKCHRQSIRVPRGKGKIAITCPRCRERFIRKT